MLNEIPKYKNVKTRLCQERRKSLGTDQTPEDSSKIVFAEKVLLLANNISFLRIDHTEDSGTVEDSGRVLFVIAGVRL